MIKNKTIFRNFIWNTIGSTLASFNSLFFLIAITRINGLDDAGIFSITFAIVSVFYVFAQYSGRSCHITDIQEKIKDKDYIVSRIITCTVMMILVIIFTISQYDFYKCLIFLFVALWRCLEAFGDVFYGVLQKNDKLDLVGKSLVIKSIMGILLFVVIDYFTNSLIYACITLPIVSFLTIICYDLPRVKRFIKKEERATKENIIKIYKNEFFLFASAFLTMYLLNAPKYAIEKYLTNEIQGIYAIVLMPASILPLFSQFMIAPVIRKLTQFYKEHQYSKIKKIKKELTMLIFAFGIFSMIMAYLIGIPVLKWIYRQDLTQYKVSLVLIILAYILYAAGTVEITILTLYRKIKDQFYIYLMASVFAFTTSNILVKVKGEEGIIPTYLITMFIYYFLFVIVTKYRTYQKINKGEKKNAT